MSEEIEIVITNDSKLNKVLTSCESVILDHFIRCHSQPKRRRKKSMLMQMQRLKFNMEVSMLSVWVKRRDIFLISAKKNKQWFHSINNNNRQSQTYLKWGVAFVWSVSVWGVFVWGHFILCKYIQTKLKE